MSITKTTTYCKIGTGKSLILTLMKNLVSLALLFPFPNEKNKARRSVVTCPRLHYLNTLSPLSARAEVPI